MTVDEALEKVDEQGEWAAEYEKHLAAEVRRLRQHCGICGEHMGTAHVCNGTWVAPAGYFGPAQTFSPPCAKCADLERDLAAARAEVNTWHTRYTAAHERLTHAEAEEAAERALVREVMAERDAARVEAARLRKAIEWVLESPGHMGHDDIDKLLGALEGKP